MTRLMERLLRGRALVPAGGRLLLLHPDEETAHAVMAFSGAATVLLTHRSLAALHSVVRALGVNAVGVTEECNGVTVTACHAFGLPLSDHSFATGAYDAAVVRLPTDARSAHLLLLHAASVLREGALVHVIGGTNEGVRSIGTVMQTAFDAVHTAAHAGGLRVVVGTHRGSASIQALRARCAPFDDPQYMDPLEVSVVQASGASGEFTVFRRPGVFSFDHADEATLLLSQHMRLPANADVLDLGCGSGLLGAVAWGSGAARSVTLVDTDCEAVRCATRTMQTLQERAVHADGSARTPASLPSWRVLSSDVTSAVADAQYNVVVSNPPFHTGKATDLALPARFIREAASVLRDGGVLQLVANRTLPYEALLEQTFGNRRVLHDGRRFKVIEARATHVPHLSARAMRLQEDHQGR